MSRYQEARELNRIPEFVHEMSGAMQKITTEAADGLLVRLLYYAMVDEFGRDAVHRELNKRMEGQR